MSTEQFSVSGDVALVTGGSRGIGRAIAEQFVADDVDVVLCSREGDEVRDVADEIVDVSTTDADAVGVECDVRDRDDVASMVDAAVSEFGGVDVLVNNAATTFTSAFDDIDPEGWASVLETNLLGTYNCTRAAADPLRDGGGSVVNIASVAGLQGSAYMSHYAASKAAVINLTRTLGFEWAEFDVRVNCVAPGYVTTPAVEENLGIEADDVDRDEVARQTGLPEEVADIVQFLASPASSYVVGETLRARGRPDLKRRPDR